MNKLNVLVACEFSGIVREAFKARGHNAWSCDLLDTEIPGQHIKDDVLKHLNDGWDMMIAHPPCNHLAVSGARYFEQKRRDGRQQLGIDFFMNLINAPVVKIAVENPVGIMSTIYRKPDQIIQPWQFGNDASKKTCLWLKNLPPLIYSFIIYKKTYSNQTDSGQNKIIIDNKWIGYNDKRTAMERSRTFPGIANAMAEQWG